MIAFEDASFRYGTREILANVTFALAPGSFHFLTGPSGSGKTTLLKLCYLALRPSAGRMLVRGRDAAEMASDDIARLRQRIGVVHQDCTFLDHLTVRENIALPLRVMGRRLEQHRGDLDDLIGWVGLRDRAEAYPPELSGGERQRAALARAVIGDPDLIIADEPTGNVDWDMAERLMRLLVELNRLGKSILLATHDLSLIRATKSQASVRVLRLKDARMQLAGADL
ncbi:MAG: ATP-binding cassette domain-containing protein [Pseudomonadota bacterium]